jgi:hypothetical protein
VKDNQTPEWLTKIQYNSWEPEIIISGLSIAFFFILPKYIYNFTAMLIQDYGANAFLSSVQYAIMIFIVTSLQVLFMGHLVLRGFWAGLVGLSYVFPQGIVREHLNNELKDCTFKKPIDLVIEVEKICSLIFSFAFIIILYLIKIITMYAVLLAGFILLYEFKLNSGETQIVQVSLLAVLSTIFIGYLKLKNTKFAKRTANSVTSNLIYTFSTNISKKTFVMILVGFAIITLPLSVKSISKFRFDVQDKLKSPESSMTYVDQNNYLDTRGNGLRVQRAVLDSFLIEKDYVELNISSYRYDEILLRDIHANYDKYKAIMPGIEPDKLNQANLYKVFIDNEPIRVNDWFLNKDSDHSQKFLTAYLPVDSLSAGLHTLKIERVSWRKKEKDFVLLENWISIPFKIKR